MIGSLKSGQPIASALVDEEGILEGEEKSEFLSFISNMLQWRPEDRASARELLQHPWLRSFASGPVAS